MNANALRLQVRSTSNVGQAVKTAHHLDPEAGTYLPTQGWAWAAVGDVPEGEALVVVVNSLTDNRLPYVFVRLGKKVHTLRAKSVVAALTSLGIANITTEF